MCALFAGGKGATNVGDRRIERAFVRVSPPLCGRVFSVALSLRFRHEARECAKSGGSLRERREHILCFRPVCEQPCVLCTQGSFFVSGAPRPSRKDRRRSEGGALSEWPSGWGEKGGLCPGGWKERRAVCVCVDSWFRWAKRPKRSTRGVSVCEDTAVGRRHRRRRRRPFHPSTKTHKRFGGPCDYIPSASSARECSHTAQPCGLFKPGAAAAPLRVCTAAAFGTGGDSAAHATNSPPVSSCPALVVCVCEARGATPSAQHCVPSPADDDLVRSMRPGSRVRAPAQRLRHITQGTVAFRIRISEVFAKKRRPQLFTIYCREKLSESPSPRLTTSTTEDVLWAALESNSDNTTNQSNEEDLLLGNNNLPPKLEPSAEDQKWEQTFETVKAVLEDPTFHRYQRRKITHIASKKRRLAEESEDDRLSRLQREAEAKRRRRLNETPEKRQRRLALHAERMRKARRINKEGTGTVVRQYINNTYTTYTQPDPDEPAQISYQPSERVQLVSVPQHQQYHTQPVSQAYRSNNQQPTVITVPLPQQTMGNGPVTIHVTLPENLQPGQQQVLQVSLRGFMGCLG
uniref:Ribosome biogenesis protein NOP53 n=1 Tax=Bursaphelenchus xylophilus TaxID=6326 RepID=A0A1I7RTZ8_BURXY